MIMPLYCIYIVTTMPVHCHDNASTMSVTILLHHILRLQTSVGNLLAESYDLKLKTKHVKLICSASNQSPYTSWQPSECILEKLSLWLYFRCHDNVLPLSWQCTCIWQFKTFSNLRRRCSFCYHVHNIDVLCVKSCLPTNRQLHKNLVASLNFTWKR